MTIYATPFDPATKQCTGPSTDSGMATLDEVVMLMGPPDHAGQRVHTYTGAGVAFSDFVLSARIDTAANLRHDSGNLLEDCP